VARDPRVRWVLMDAAVFLKDNADQRFDLIFADAPPGKLWAAGDALALLAPGGVYVVDDMRGHDPGSARSAELEALRRRLAEDPSLASVELDWSSGVLLAVRRA
jgi:predicted O-methyltransferase YrrM